MPLWWEIEWIPIVVVGIESGLETILVFSGFIRKEDVDHFPYRPNRILDSVAAIEF